VNADVRFICVKNEKLCKINKRYYILKYIFCIFFTINTQKNGKKTVVTVFLTNPGEIIFREVPVPEVKENQVLVKIMNIGVCGSDIHI